MSKKDNICPYRMLPFFAVVQYKLYDIFPREIGCNSKQINLIFVQTCLAILGSTTLHLRSSTYSFDSNIFPPDSPGDGFYKDPKSVVPVMTDANSTIPSLKSDLYSSYSNQLPRLDSSADNNLVSSIFNSNTSAISIQLSNHNQNTLVLNSLSQINSGSTSELTLIQDTGILVVGLGL